MSDLAGDGRLDTFDSTKYEPDGIGLALSGGGYKAAAYHLGALIRLNELGLLPRISRIASVSGGSITAGFLGLKWSNLTFDAKGVATNFSEVIITPLRAFLTGVTLDWPQILLGLLPFRSASDGVAAGYAKHLFGKATLQDLPAQGKGPQFVLLATNYELNSLWRFARNYAADYRVGRINAPRFSLAEIVAASSAFPPFFCPLTLDLKSHVITPLPGADCSTGPFAQRALLADGGIYDNMGLEPIWKRCGILLVSNAGNNFAEDQHPTDWGRLMYRIIGMMHRQAENNRQRWLMDMVSRGERKLAYWPLRVSAQSYPKPSPSAPDTEQGRANAQAARDEKVLLRAQKEPAFARLVNHGYSLSDSAVGSYLPQVGAPPPVAPY